MWVVTGLCATLSDYITMVEFMQREFVTEAFVVYDHKRGYLQLCCLINEDEEVNSASHWFPNNYNIQEFDDDIAELDQPLSIESCMLISIANSDLIHTKNLKNTRSCLCECLGLTIPAAARVIDNTILLFSTMRRLQVKADRRSPTSLLR